MKATFQKYVLKFKRPSGTSRGILEQKESWFIMLESNGKLGIGECGLLKGLSVDDRPDYESKLQWACDHIYLGQEALWEELKEFPSIQFGMEMAFKSLESEYLFNLFPSAFTQGDKNIPINGLVWMGDPSFMKSQIRDRLSEGFQCIKMKIGAIAFDMELSLLKALRQEFGPSDIEIRVDANGGFNALDALEKLKRLSELNLHSIEQPIKTKQWEQMAQLCLESPLPIALDEELIGIFEKERKKQLLETIRPQYIILKPSFIGGFKGSDEWIDLAEKYSISWWVTSALESNVGLNAISQFTFLKNSKLPQGLGTGSLYTNNIPSPLVVHHGNLVYDRNKKWDTSPLKIDYVY